MRMATQNRCARRSENPREKTPLFPARCAHTSPTRRATLAQQCYRRVSRTSPAVENERLCGVSERRGFRNRSVPDSN